MSESATEVLRRMLDERGVEWSTRDTTFRLITYWKTDSGIPVHYAQTTDVPYPPTNVPRTITAGLTPEQAIAATLGGGECEVECFDDGVDEGMDGEWFSYAPPTWYLSCGHEVQGTERPNYCVVCGKAVKR